MRPSIEAITLDFYGTLVYHRDGRGRGHNLVQYLRAQGLEPDPWDHQVLYEAFARHDVDYAPALSEDRRQAYLRQLTITVFERLGLPIDMESAASHAGALWEILGPPAFALYSEVDEVLTKLRQEGYPLAVVSNWQRGLKHFCTELGLDGVFDHILSSDELGVSKPDPRIFSEACRRLGTAPERVLHVGDTPSDDYAGARAAGMNALLLQREAGIDWPDLHAIVDLRELPSHLR